MEVAFYHDDPSYFVSGYAAQSSPGSVDSISSTDSGPVCAIAAVPPAYREQSFGQDFAKTASLKGMNLQVHSRNANYSSAQQLNFSLSPTNGYQQSTSFDAVNKGNTSEKSFDQDLPQADTPVSIPELVDMLKLGSSDPDQLLSVYGQADPQQYSGNRAHEHEMYVQSYARELVRQRRLTENESLVTSMNPMQAPSMTSQGSADQYALLDTYSVQRQRQSENVSSRSLGGPISTVHHLANQSLLATSREDLRKEDPSQTVPVLSPVNMETQEAIKVERKRLRNRLAASKCRKRKLERISRLEDKVNNLKSQNLELSSNANLLRQQVAELHSKVMAHVNSGCQMMMPQQQMIF